MQSIAQILILLILPLAGLQAQTLNPIDPPIFPPVKLTEGEVILDERERLNVKFESSINNSKTYTVRGIALDRRKQAIEDITAEAVEISGGGIIDLSFRFKKVSDKNYTRPELQTYFLQVVISEKQKGGGLGDLFGNDGNNKIDDLFSIKYTYEYDKEWRVSNSNSSNSNEPTMVIKVQLKPMGKATTIRS